MISLLKTLFASKVIIDNSEQCIDTIKKHLEANKINRVGLLPSTCLYN